MNDPNVESKRVGTVDDKGCSVSCMGWEESGSDGGQVRRVGASRHQTVLRDVQEDFV